MTFTTGDILRHEAGIWLSQDFLLNNTALSADYLRVAKSRAKQANNAASWRNIMLQDKCYFDYSALGKSIKAQLPQSDLLGQYAAEIEDEITALVRTAMLDTYRLFLSIYANYAKNQRMALAQASAIVHEAKAYCEKQGISYSKSAFFEALAKELGLNDTKYLPKSWRNLRNKVKAYADGTAMRELVYPKNEGNKAATLSNSDLIKGWLVELGSSEKNYSSAFIHRKLRLMCEQHSLDNCPSIRWVSGCIADPQTQFLIQERHGNGSRFNARYRGYTPMQSALYAGDCWQIDGTRVNITDHRIVVVDPKDGKRKTIQKYLYIVAIRDVMSGLPLGWAYCHEESADVIVSALACAVRNAGYLPYEIVYDRFPGHNTDEWAWVEGNLQRKGVLMTRTSKAEGKANIERWFGTLQNVFMAESDLYYGEGIKSTRRYAHRTKEYVQQMRAWALQRNFSFDDACRETDRILDAYCTTKLSDYSRKFATIDRSPEQLHADSDKPNTCEIAEHDYCYLFGIRKGVSIRNYMIQTQIDNATYYYGVDDCSVVEQYTGVKLTNCFDHEDLSRVHLFDGDRYLGTFAEVPAAQRYGKDRDMRGVGITKAIGDKMATHRAAKLQEIDTRKEQALKELEAAASGGSEVDEITIMSGGKVHKHNYEDAETTFLRKEWAVAEDDEEEITITVQNQY